MFYFMNVMCSFVDYVIFHELCDRIQFEVDCAKSHHHVISDLRPVRGISYGIWHTVTAL